MELFLFFFFFLAWADAPNVYVRAWALCCLHSRISTQTFRRALTASGDSCAEIWSASLLAEFGGRCRKAMLGVRVPVLGRDAQGRPPPLSHSSRALNRSPTRGTSFIQKKKLFSIFHCCVLDWGGRHLHGLEGFLHQGIRVYLKKK